MLLAFILASAALVQSAPAQPGPAQTAPPQTAPAQTKPAQKTAHAGTGASTKAKAQAAAKTAPDLPPPFGVSDVIKLLNAKVAEGIIVDMIRKQNIKISLTSQDLVNLATAGATPRIMHELDSSLGGSPDPVPVAAPVVHEDAPVARVADPNDPDTSHTPGVYLYTEDRNGKRKMVKLEKTVPQTSRSKMTGFLGTALFAFVPRPAASIRAADRQPVFYMYAPQEEKVDMTVDNPNQLQLIKMDPQSIYGVEGRRFLYAKAANMFSRPIIGTDPKAMRFFKSETKGPGYFRVLPDQQLEPGEYCFFYFIGGMGAGKGTEGNVILLDFGVE